MINSAAHQNVPYCFNQSKGFSNAAEPPSICVAVAVAEEVVEVEVVLLVVMTAVAVIDVWEVAVRALRLSVQVSVVDAVTVAGICVA